MNNLDVSSNGVNLELYCGYDISMAQDNFNENFKALDNGQFLFIDYGNFSDNFEFDDLINYDVKSQTVKNLLTNIRVGSYGSSDDLKDDCLHYFGKYPYQLNKSELLELVENTSPTDEYIEFLQDNFIAKYELIDLYGYSQGDYAQVIFSHIHLKEYDYDNKSDFLSMMQEFFTNLFYSAPIYIDLIIEDENQDINSELKNEYNYDIPEVFNIANKIINHPKKKYILNWLVENLPAELDYI